VLAIAKHQYNVHGDGKKTAKTKSGLAVHPEIAQKKPMFCACGFKTISPNRIGKFF